MNYRNDKYGNPVSILGFGCMRFPRKQGKIDFQETERQILESIRLGVNYFDTAYIYPGSEATLGEILEKNGLRQQVKIATKLPHYLIRNMQAMEKLFQEQLKRLKTDYVDYYLMHMLCDVPTWNRLKEMGIEQWIEEKRASGAIRQVGFSYHGNSETFCNLVDAYDWDFCQIQYNYMDENTQAGRRGLNHAASKGIPVIIMEPLRGGKLVNNLPEEALKIFPDHPADCINIGILAEQLTGVKAPDVKRLEDVFPPPEFLTQEEFAQLTPEAQNWFIQSNVAISGKRKV